MHRDCIRYKDTWAAPGSKLHEALTGKDEESAEALYQKCAQDEKELVEPKEPEK